MIYPFSKRFFEQLALDIVERLQIETDRQGLDLGRMLTDATVE